MARALSPGPSRPALVMPRVSPKLVRLAAAQSPLLPPLLRANRTLENAQAELRWIKQELPRDKWVSAVQRRSQLEPLQYILGTQPFGSLDILCEKGVLIPRWETEEWASELADILRKSPQPLKIVDACTGTGCIPLYLKSQMPNANVAGFDISPSAIVLARRNREKAQLDVAINSGDVFSARLADSYRDVDIITANPPYIPEADYNKLVLCNGPQRSVRLYEPKLALVGHLEFYEALVKNLLLPSGATGLVCELGYDDQAAATMNALPDEWSGGEYMDSAGKLRCVVAWLRDSHSALLETMVNGTRFR